MRFKYILLILRPQQWIKNSLVFAALIFSQNLTEPELFVKTLWAFFILCGISSTAYILNDIIDINRDKNHPEKSKRPIASGLVSIAAAIFLSLFTGIISMALAFFLNYQFGIIVSIYLLMNIIYSIYLKNLVIIDVIVIAIGFVLRALAGAVVINVEFSHWLLITTLLLALFLGFGKRRHELVLLNSHAAEHRGILSEYNSYFLDQMISVVTASTLIVYILYTTSQDVILRIGSINMIYTIPFVLYGIFRYLYLIHQKNLGGSPTKIIFTDKPLILNIFFWLATVVMIIYYF